jgi:hypothetical protein
MAKRASSGVAATHRTQEPAHGQPECGVQTQNSTGGLRILNWVWSANSGLDGL